MGGYWRISLWSHSGHGFPLFCVQLDCCVADGASARSAGVDVCWASAGCGAISPDSCGATEVSADVVRCAVCWFAVGSCPNIEMEKSPKDNKKSHEMLLR